MAPQLSQDLPENIDTIDILGGEEETTLEETGDIIPEVPAEEAEPEAKTEEVTDTNVGQSEEATEEVTEAPGEETAGLEDIIGDNKEIKEDIDNASEATEEMKDTIEEAKEAIQEEDTDSAEKLIDDLYKQVIEYSTKVDTLSTKNEVLQAKLVELTNSNADYELQAAQNVNKSNDPKMLILNRMYDGAVSGEEFSKNKVISTLEDMYYGLTNKTFDETKVDKISDQNAEGVVLNEMTEPVVKEPTPEDVDLNDINSIF